MEDRTIRGVLAGILAGIIMNLWNLIDFYLFHITDIRFLDWSSVLVTWSRPTNSFTTIFFLAVNLLWDGFLGILFAQLLVSITSKGIIIKSSIFSLICWFTFKIIANLYRVPFLSGQQSIPGSISNVIGVIIWGITLGIILKRMEKHPT